MQQKKDRTKAVFLLFYQEPAHIGQLLQSLAMVLGLELIVAAIPPPG